MSERFKAFLDLATPEVYEQNAFRLLEVHVEATDRDLSKRKQIMEAAARTGLNAQASPHQIFPRKPAPDEHEIRNCAYAIQDAERRIAHEFFWFWPLVPGKTAEDLALRQLNRGDTEVPVKAWRSHEHLPAEGPASKHNLAVLYHFAALRVEKEFLNGKPLSSSGDGATAAGAQDEQARISDAEAYWAEAFRYWNMVAIEQNCWSRVASRIRAMDDRSLTTGTARRMEQTLPLALALITVRLAIRFFQAGKLNHAQRHVARLRTSGLATEAVEEALRIAVEPTRSSIKTLCDAAKAEAERDPDQADSVAQRLLNQTNDALALLDLLLPENSPARIAEHDQVALTALGGCILFGNKTLNWKRALELQDMLASLAASTAAKDRISHNRAILQDNYNSTVCWFCGQNQGDEKCAVEVKMHGDVQRMPAMLSIGGIQIPDPNGGIRITWRHLAVKIPRCPACRDEASREETVYGFGCLGLVLGAVLIGILSSKGATELGIVLGLLVAVVPAVVAHMRAAKSARPGLKKRAQNDFPRIKELQAQGWAFGEKPEGVQ